MLEVGTGHVDLLFRQLEVYTGTTSSACTPAATEVKAYEVIFDHYSVDRHGDKQTVQQQDEV